MNAAATRGLGKGLSALMGESYSQTVTKDSAAGSEATGNNTPQQLGIGKLVSGKYQPRLHFREDQLKELSESIAKNGIMQPILVRPLAKSGTYEIIAGERRWRAAKLAKLETVPVIIRELSDQLALEFAIVENVQRTDLSPLEEAAGYQRLIDEFQYTQDTLATTVGKSRSHIANLLRLLGLPDSIKQMLEEGVLTMGHARALITAPNADALAKQIVAEDLSVRQTEDLVRSQSDATPARRPRAGSPQNNAKQPSSGRGRYIMDDENKDGDILSLEASLSENLGLKVSINDRGNNGEIILVYESLSQLDEILRRLGGSI